MALEYNNQTNFETLAPVLEEYAGWFGSVALSVGFPEDKSALEKISAPNSFQYWVKNVEAEGELNSLVLEDIIKVHDDMLRTGGIILDAVRSGKKVERDSFVEFKNIYSAFLSRLRRLEKDTAMDGSGLDEATGLRNSKVIQDDLKKENERLSRQGNPFSLVMTRVDGFPSLADQKASLSIATANVKRCMRSFDDAYYLGEGHFLLSLKHADIIGAQAATGRLQQYLQKDEANHDKMTMSYCVAEPVQGDEMPNLLKNMRQDLDDHLHASDAVLKFLERSPLERFVNKIGD